MNDYFVFISAEKAFFPIDWMCRKLKVSRVGVITYSGPTVSI